MLTGLDFVYTSNNSIEMKIRKSTPFVTEWIFVI